MFNPEQVQQLSDLRVKLVAQHRAMVATELDAQKTKETPTPKVKLDERFIAGRVEVEGKKYVVVNLDADSGPWKVTTPYQVSAYHSARYSGQFHVITQGFRGHN